MIMLIQVYKVFFVGNRIVDSVSLVALAYALYIVQFGRLIWLKTFDSEMLIELQELNLLLKFAFLFFLGQETFTLVWLSKRGRNYDLSLVKRLLLVGVVMTTLFILILNLQYGFNFETYSVYILSTLFWALVRNVLRLVEKHRIVYVVDLLLALAIWLLFFYTRSLLLSLNIIGLVSLVISGCFLVRNIGRGVSELSAFSLDGVWLIIASSFSTLFQQLLLFLSREKYSISEWSDLSFELSLVNGIWMAAGVIIWRVQTILWGQSRADIVKSQKYFLLSSTLFTLLGLAMLMIISKLNYLDISSNSFYLFCLFYPLYAITPIQSYLVSKAHFGWLSASMTISLLVVLICVYLGFPFFLSFVVGPLLFSLLIVIKFHETQE